jgi:hypothetical protein
MICCCRASLCTLCCRARVNSDSIVDCRVLCSLSLMDALSLSHTHTHGCSLSLADALSLSRAGALSLSLSRMLSLSLSWMLCLYLSRWCSVSLSRVLSLSHTDDVSLTNPLSLSILWFVVVFTLIVFSSLTMASIWIDRAAVALRSFRPDLLVLLFVHASGFVQSSFIHSNVL